MSTDAKILKHLTDALALELTAINQYLLHAHVLTDWGFKKLAAKLREEMSEEQAHADRIISRIMFLGGHPDTSKLNKIYTVKSVIDMFKADLKEEQAALAFYSRAAKDCEEQSDYVSRALFVSLLVEEQGHVEWLMEQMHMIERLGESNYLQLQI